MALKFLLRRAQRHSGALLGAAALMLLSSGAALTIPWLAGRLTGAVFFEGGSRFELLLGAIAGALTVQALVRVALNVLVARTAADLTAELRREAHDHLQSLPLGYHHDRRRGTSVALVERDAEDPSGFIAHTLPSVASLAVTFTGALVMMLRIDIALGLVVAAMVPVFVLVTRLWGRSLKPLSARYTATRAETVATAEENLGMLPAIKAFARERDASERFGERVAEQRSVAHRAALAFGSLQPVTQLIASAGVLALLAVAGRRVVAGTLSPEALVSFLLYGMLLAQPMSGFAGVYGATQRALAASRRLLAVFGEQPEPRGGEPVGELRGELEWRDVSFAYPDREPVLRDVGLRIAPGETVALTGANGGGKTTLTRLLLRFIEPSAGRVLVDGRDTAQLDVAELRRAIGLVPQEMLLLGGTVRENIAWGLPADTAPDEAARAIEDAAKRARAHDFITALPDGYDTVIGERGVKLSGGQQQRIALARAIVKDPRVLILDEATAMFDPEGEREFLEQNEAWLAERTVLLITHRPASLRLADRVVSVDGGRISEPPRDADATGVRAVS